MKKITEYQKEFIMHNFFSNNMYGDFPGWKNIAASLLEKGTCIVAGEKCIWLGGIGNFIKVTETNLAIGCLMYEFDLEYFLSSEWYKEICNCYLQEISDKISKLTDNYKEILNLNKE